ncbi:hypothetical protein Scep_029494 [Stephania cephalantha]|uniref:O-methyltransferase C-terminal domain-containing protein n=1 Tax=Stephania cephalantha TaxID=152367 RepID=A0AAP0HC95_9MAGN
MVVCLIREIVTVVPWLSRLGSERNRLAQDVILQASPQSAKGLPAPAAPWVLVITQVYPSPHLQTTVPELEPCIISQFGGRSPASHLHPSPHSNTILPASGPSVLLISHLHPSPHSQDVVWVPPVVGNEHDRFGVLHNWSDEECVKILKRCREATSSKGEGGKVIIVDIVIEIKESTHESTENQLMFDMEMVVEVNSGTERTKHEWSWFHHLQVYSLFGFKVCYSSVPLD